MKKISLSLVFRCLALGLGVASVVLLILGEGQLIEIVKLLAISVTSLSIASIC